MIEAINFPIKSELSKDFLVENFWKCNYTNIEKEYQYSIILPNNVKPIEIDEVANKELSITEIGTYIRIDNSPYLEVSVAYEHLLYEMNASDWLKKKLYLMGERIINERIISGEYSGTYLDILTVKKTNGGEEVISRYTTIKDSSSKGGANYFLTKVSCPVNAYKEYSNIIFHISSNWDLLNKSKWRLGEVLNTFNYDLIGETFFYYPISWNIKFEKDTLSKSFLRLVFERIDNGKNTGVINAFFYDINTANSEHEILDKSFDRIKKLPNYRVEISNLEKINNKEINLNLKNLYTASGFISSNDDHFDSCLLIYIIQTEEGWYYFESVGSKPNLENYNWEINKRCLELIINSFNNLEFERIGDRKQEEKSIDQSYYKKYKGKIYTEEEWKEFEKKQWEYYAKKNNIQVDIEKERNKKGGGFFLDEKESRY